MRRALLLLSLFACTDASPPAASQRQYEWSGRLDVTVDGTRSIAQTYLAAGESLHSELARHYEALQPAPIDGARIRANLLVLCSCIPLDKLNAVFGADIEALYPRELIDSAYGMRCASSVDATGNVQTTATARALIGPDVRTFTMIASNDAAVAALLGQAIDVPYCRPITASHR